MTPAERYFAALKEQNRTWELHREVLRLNRRTSSNEDTWQKYKAAVVELVDARAAWDGYEEWRKAREELGE